MQAFRQVATPVGTFHCPAYRDNKKGYIGERDSFSDSTEFKRTIGKINKSINKFNSLKNCGDKFCFYHQVNSWIESLIDDEIDLETLTVEKPFNSFL